MTPLAQLIEAALFAAARPLTVEELQTLDPDATLADVRTALDQLREHYDFDGHAVELVELAGGYQIADPAGLRRGHRAGPARGCGTPRLTAAALETLAVISYRQPVGRAEIEEIRGVSAGGVLRTLQERGLIEVVGRSEALGRPLLYGTTSMFLELLGLRDLGELPRAEEFTVALQPPQAGVRGLRGRRGLGRRPNHDRDAAPAGPGAGGGRLAPGGRGADRGGTGPGGRQGGDARASKVDPDRQKITVGGRALPGHAAAAGSRSTSRSAWSPPPSDEEGRRTVFDFIQDPARPHLRRPARRDDDRAAAPHHRRRRGAPAHPSHATGSQRSYTALVHGRPTAEIAAAVQAAGDDRRPAGGAGPASGCAPATAGRSIVDVTLAEGRNRIVRQWCEAMGLKVERLARLSYGPVRLGDLPVGRVLARSRPKEEAAIYKAIRSQAEDRASQPGCGVVMSDRLDTDHAHDQRSESLPPRPG